jgi:rhodanese-related sulfurtransferase
MKARLFTLVVIFLLSNIVFGQSYTIQTFETINVSEAESLIQEHYLNPNFIILDVRTENEYATKHLENGVLLNYNAPSFSEILDTLIKDKTYLVHCASGGRSTGAFNMMQTKGFQEVYNMSGGINAWVSASYPITTEVAPICLSISDTLANFNTIFPDTDTLKIKLTNYGNDSINFTSISDLSSTEFSTNFNLEAQVSGLMDYEFEVYYTPTDAIADSVVFEIESDGGLLTYVLKGENVETHIQEEFLSDIKVYPNPCKDYLFVEMEGLKSIELYNITGKLVYKQECSINYNNRLDVSNLDKGIYQLRLVTDKQRKTIKIIKED